MEAKFTPTDLENARAELEKLPESDDKNEKITREEFDEPVDSMTKTKTATRPGRNTGGSLATDSEGRAFQLPAKSMEQGIDAAKFAVMYIYHDVQK